MIRNRKNYQSEIRNQMRGGNGSVKIEHLFDEATELLSHPRMVAKLTLEPGCSIGFHTHVNEEEIFYIICGEAEIDDNGKISQVKSGDSILTGNGDGHAVKNTGNSTLEILATILKYQ